MKMSNFDCLIERYVAGKTSKAETTKIEAMLKVIRRRKIHFISEETEEFLYGQIVDHKVTADRVALSVDSFSKLKVPGINRLRIEPFEIYFQKDII